MSWLCALKCCRLSGVCHININTQHDASRNTGVHVEEKTTMTLSYRFFMNSVECAFISETHTPINPILGIE